MSTRYSARRALEAKRSYLEEHEADLFVIGGDWIGRFDYLNDHCDVQYLPRAEGVDSTGVLYAATAKTAGSVRP